MSTVDSLFPVALVTVSSSLQNQKNNKKRNYKKSMKNDRKCTVFKLSERCLIDELMVGWLGFL